MQGPVIGSTTCPDPGILSAFADGRLPEHARVVVEGHLSGCSACRAAVACCLDPRLPRMNRRILGNRPIWVGAAAAACLLVLGVGGVRAWRAREGVQPHSSPGPAERFRLAAGRSGALPSGEALRLPDGTLLRSGPWTAACFLDPGPGERCHVRLDRGELDAEVAKERGGFRISAPAGEIRVLGTRFRARAFRIRLPEGSADALYVMLEEGKVSVENTRGSLQLVPSAVALAIAGNPPMQMEGSPDVATSLRELGTIVIRAENGTLQVAPGKERPARALAGSLWGEWGLGLLSRGTDPAERTGALAAAALCASKEELAEALRASEPALGDEERRILQECETARGKEATR